MKKISVIMLALMITISSFFASFAYADIIAPNSNTEQSTQEKIEELSKERGNASETTIGRVLTREEKIDYYTEQLNGNRTNGTVLYYLVKVGEYSLPVCFVGIVIASLNYFIIGNKKLEKREQGFRMLVTLVIGLIVFQILPLLFALVAGR